MTESPIPSLKWSAQFAISASSRKNALPGDKINLPASALEQLLAASSNATRESLKQDLPAYDPFNSSTFSAYKRAEAEYEDARQQLPYPLIFRLVNPENGRAVYAGIREFSAEEGEANLSPFLQEALGLKMSSRESTPEHAMETESEHASTNGYARPTITVHAKQLPKGTFVKLRPLEPGYDPEDWKALLEQHLRSNFTTLTTGEMLVVQGGRDAHGHKEEFRFLVDGFKPESDGICVVDTDLEVDIEALNEEQARETMKRIADKMAKAPGTGGGSSKGGDLDLFKAQEGQVLPNEYVEYHLSSWNRAMPLEIEVSSAGEDADVDLLVSPFSSTQRQRPRLDEHVFADFDGWPKKRIRLEPSNVEMENAEALYVSVFAFAPADAVTNGDGPAGNARRYTLRARHPDADIKMEDTSIESSQVSPNPGDVQCKNCKQWVPGRTLMLHENFCLRNNILCPHGCGQVFQSRSSEFASHWHCPHDSSYGNTASSHAKHDALHHPPEVLRCTECSTQETFSSISDVARHRTTVCPAKPILCRFCHLVVPQEGHPDVPNAEALLSGMTPHELADGARTTECHMCSKIVRLRDMETHLKSHDLDRLSRAAPMPCRNIYCGRTLDVCSKSGDTRAGTRMGQGPGNDVGLCSSCFGPLYVSMHDPENKALRRRIERRYLQQLLTGCGKAHCRNEFCKAGRKNLELPANVTTKDALPMIRPFLDGLTHGCGPLHFCVDSSSQKRKQVAEMLAAEDGGVMGSGGYGLSWCVGALEAEGGDLDAARGWLKNFAPTRKEEGRV